jgi:hypothetical protein
MFFIFRRLPSFCSKSIANVLRFRDFIFSLKRNKAGTIARSGFVFSISILRRHDRDRRAPWTLAGAAADGAGLDVNKTATNSMTFVTYLKKQYRKQLHVTNLPCP